MFRCSFFFFFTVILLTFSLAVQAADPYGIPNDKTPQELLDYAQKTVRDYPVPPNCSHEELMQETAKQAKFVVDIADAALAQKPTEELRRQAYMFKFQGLLTWTRAESTPENIQKLENFLDELDIALPKSREAKIARLLDIQRQIDLFIQKNTTEDEFERLKQVFFSLIKREPTDYPPRLVLNFIEFAEIAEIQLKKEGLISTASKELVAMLKSESSPVFQEMIKLVDATMRRLGQEFVLEGITLDGTKFNIKSLRDKVILVDFFTSWCGPCIEEFPHIKKMYAKYHDKGFEIVSVGGDEPEALRKVIKEHELPWRVVSEKLTVGKKLPSIERRYGVKTYPTMLLIDKEGKLINTNARGPRLEAALERIFWEKKD